MRLRARTDANHREVVDALRRAGCRVWDTSRVGGGFPDALVAARGNRLIMLEIKDGAKSPSRRKLTPAEADFHAEWSEHVAIVETVEQALAAVGVGVQ